MKQDFLAAFIGNQNQARILRTLILNEGERFTARELGKRIGISEEVTLKELEALKALHIVRTYAAGTSRQSKTKGESESEWSLDEQFTYLKALSRFIREVSPMHYDEIVGMLQRSGKLSTVVLSGSFMGDY